MEFPSWQRYDTAGENPALCKPWDWDISDRILNVVKTLPKNQRKKKVCDIGWCIFGVARGVIQNQPLTKENQAAAIGGLVLDYDATYNREYLRDQLAKVNPDLHPQYIEQSLGGNVRLMWVFHDWLPVINSAHATAVWKTFADLLKVDRLHPGLDESSWNPAQRWTNGVLWEVCNTKHKHVPKATMMSCMVEAARKHTTAESGEIDLKIVAQEVEKRWPGRWEGEFEVGAKGPRFWDEQADNPNGCLIKPDGVVCVTGKKAWIGWEELFGKEWVAKHKVDRIDGAIGNIWFDGRQYWSLLPHGWVADDRSDTLLGFTNQGWPNKVPKGESISPAGRLLYAVQRNNRVDLAIPMVNYPPGILQHEGCRILNTSRVKPITLAESGDPQHWRWTYEFLHQLFVPNPAHTEGQPLEYFLAWTQRGLRSLIEYSPSMGQAMFVCGPRDAGKTLLSTRILKPLFGGKEADPFSYFTGGTDFNSDLFESYFWAMNDPEDPRTAGRTTMLAKLKRAVVNTYHDYHKKYGAKTVMRWNGRNFVSLNEDPQSLAILPEVNSNTADKLMFMAVQSYSGVFPARPELEAMLEKEMPYFARFVYDLTPRKEILTDSRVGVKSYFDPDILEKSRQQNYAYNYKELLKVWVETGWESTKEIYEGSPSVIMSEMHNCPTVADLAREYKIPTVARALTTLAREEGSGVVYLGDLGRRFRIIKKDLFAA